ncbi:hypothetical protein [Desertivirga xinjiangensis]|uniref:hypothetical protein n=1 Tax=Desertivirga xinjiangensis TaxID=539206 RepID=UPI00210EAB3C|nr:hypothetical protein [Pedobacter xinjiangensis]
MNPKPVTEQVKISYQPVLLSWECWTPNVFAGSVIKPVAHVINDDEDFKDLKNAELNYELRDKANSVVFSSNLKLADVPYYGISSKELEIKIPDNVSTGNYELRGQIVSGGKVVSKNFYKIFIANKIYTQSAPRSKAPLVVYDIAGGTKKSLTGLNIAYKEIGALNRIPSESVLVIGENSADKNLADNAAQVKKFIASGGRVLALRQDSIHLANLNALLSNPLGNNNVDIDDPQYPVVTKSPRTGYYVNPERPDHPVFSGIHRENFRIWSDYTGWNPKSQGLPKIQPVSDGFTFENSEDVGSTAILANYSSGLRGVALAEQFSGKGSILISGFDIASRTNIDPVAARFLLNLLNYTASPVGHEQYPIITSPIVWGEYETEKGVVTDIYSGFLVNSTPRLPENFTKGIVVMKEGYQLAGGARSGFNTRPGIQYVANGRRPFGPFVQSFGGQPTVIDKKSTEGIGKFWCRIPEGQDMASSLVWNPGTEPLTIKIKINDLPEVSRTINPGEKISVDSPVDSGNVNMTYTGDRRLVILETAFRKKI